MYTYVCIHEYVGSGGLGKVGAFHWEVHKKTGKVRKGEPASRHPFLSAKVSVSWCSGLAECVRARKRGCVMCVCTFVYACIHAYVRAFSQTCIHKHINTCISAKVRGELDAFQFSESREWPDGNVDDWLYSKEEVCVGVCVCVCALANNANIPTL